MESKRLQRLQCIIYTMYLSNIMVMSEKKEYGTWKLLQNNEQEQPHRALKPPFHLCFHFIFAF